MYKNGHVSYDVGEKTKSKYVFLLFSYINLPKHCFVKSLIRMKQSFSNVTPQNIPTYHNITLANICKSTIFLGIRREVYVPF